MRWEETNTQPTLGITCTATLDEGTNQTLEHVALFRTNVLDPSQWGTRRPAETSRSTAIPRQFRLRHFSTFAVVCWWELLAMIIMS